MASDGIIGASVVGDADQPSPTIWGDCPNGILNDKGTGLFVNGNFGGKYYTAAGTTGPADLGFDADSNSTYETPADSTYGTGVLAIGVTNTDNNALALFSTPLGKIVRNSGNKLWAETRFAAGALGDSAFFFGLAEVAACTRDIVIDNPSNSAAAVPASNTLIGFVSVQAASAIATVNAVYRKGSATLVTVATNVTNSVALPSASRANLVANTFRKFGIYFDGKKKLTFFVDGKRVASQEVDSTIDQAKNYAAILGIKTGAATAVKNYTAFFRGATQVRF